jgi:calcineurin-like phosphoesterase family protein
MIYFTSDTHFRDPRVLAIDRRPFSNITEHDETLIRYWNSVVEDQDDVWHLGDFMLPHGGDCDGLLFSLKGRKHLIIGNNDATATITASGWSSVQHYAELVLENQHVILCHYPFRTWNKMGKKSLNLHGHSHGRLKPMLRQFDVGVDARDLRPITLRDLKGKGIE